ncbi:L,D-transpeptidase [Metabacillus sp. RGM 3146]|uniref:L,D-transpeptidase n=1 Tax=Metabacillus sp. RGM 3146 TaxID=3401092 RepID=UPI003B9AB929
MPLYGPAFKNSRINPYSIIVSLSKKRLFLLKAGRIVKNYPVGIGKMLTRTPVGKYFIVNREPNPGEPYGEKWLGLSKPHYGIHGTDNPATIGKTVSHGCIRMYNKDVLELASLVPNGTAVKIQR